MSVDWSRSIQTEDGDKARLLCTDVNDPKYPVAVGVTHCGKEYVRQYTLDGHPDGDIPNIINVPPRMSVDWTKPIQTRCGVRVRLVGAVNYGDDRETRVVVRVGKDGKDFGRLWECYEDGRQLGESDIINVPPRKETREVVAWVEVNKYGETMAVYLREPIPNNGIVRLTGICEAEVKE